MECSRKYEKEGMEEQPSRIGVRYFLWKLLTGARARGNGLIFYNLAFFFIFLHLAPSFFYFFTFGPLKNIYSSLDLEGRRQNLWLRDNTFRRHRSWFRGVYPPTA